MSTAAESDLARGIALHERGAIEEALAAYERALAASPAHAMAQMQAGTANLQLRRWARAAAHLRVAVAANPDFAEAYSNLAFAHLELQRFDDAHAAVERALALKPGLADAWNLRGLVAGKRGGHDESKEHFRRAIALHPKFANAWVNLANAEQATGQIDAALEAYGKARAIDPGLSEAHYNIGHLYHKTGRAQESLAHYRQAIATRPDSMVAHLNLAHALLLLGRFDEGWLEYRWRPSRSIYVEGIARLGRRYALPAPADAATSRLAISAEQGLGDILFFLRYAPLLRERGARLDFAGAPRLSSVLERTGLFEAIAAEIHELPDRAAVEVLAGDLPMLAEGAGTPPALRLAADPARLAAACARLAALGPPPYVALAWRSGVANVGPLEALFKEIPTEQLGAALSGIEATFVSVQREPVVAEVEAIAAKLGRPLHDLSDANHDLEDALALMAAIDEYVGVSSTLVHLLAGVGGKRAQVLVPFPPEWRWMESGASPWFAEFGVHRQDAAHGWEAALVQAAAALSRNASRARTGSSRPKSSP